MNILNARLQQKHDIPANWEVSKLIPLAGEIIVYDDRYIDSEYNEVIVADAIRYKIGNGISSVNDLPFVDASELAREIKELNKRIEAIESLTPINGTIVITDSDNGKSIGVAISPNEGNALVAVENGLFVPTVTVPQYAAGDGIEITDNKVSIKLADTTHGLAAVDGALSINLATRETDGALSKEDKLLLDSIPYVYEPRKYDISDVPAGTLVDYSDYEIRIMCPKDAEFAQQNVGANGNPNMYYMTFKAYAPEGAVSYKEGDRGVIIDEIHTFDEPASGIDEFGRRYSVCWLAIASYDSNTDTWSYFGKNSTESKYIGWDYCVEWYNEFGDKLGYDDIRINLSNENCHSSNKPYYLAKYATTAEVASIKDSFEEAMFWGEI